MLAIILLIVLGVNACGLSNYCLVWVDVIPTIHDLFECCFQADLSMECERRRGYRRTLRCTSRTVDKYSITFIKPFNRLNNSPFEHLSIVLWSVDHRYTSDRHPGDTRDIVRQRHDGIDTTVAESHGVLGVVDRADK
jgi:hypothetical protein